MFSFVCSAFSNHQYLSECWKKPYKWKIVTKPHCKQTDGDSRGVYVMKVRNVYMCMCNQVARVFAVATYVIATLTFVISCELINNYIVTI